MTRNLKQNRKLDTQNHQARVLIRQKLYVHKAYLWGVACELVLPRRVEFELMRHQV